MGAGPDLSRAQRPLRWGILLALIGALFITAIPGLTSGYLVTFGGEEARVASFASWTLPGLDVTFSMPPASEDSASLEAWMVEQLAMGIYAIAVLIYYGALAIFSLGMGQIGVAVYRLYNSADALNR